MDGVYPTVADFCTTDKDPAVHDFEIVGFWHRSVGFRGHLKCFRQRPPLTNRREATKGPGGVSVVADARRGLNSEC